MAQRKEVVAVYTAGMIQGLALVTFPAASSIFTSPQYYGLSSTAYGGLFLPQAIMAIAASLSGGGLDPPPWGSSGFTCWVSPPTSYRWFYSSQASL